MRPGHTAGFKLSPLPARRCRSCYEVRLRLGFLGFGVRPAPTPSLPSQKLPRWNGPAPRSQLGLSSPDKVKGHQEETLKTNNPPKWLFAKSYTGWRGPEPLVRRGRQTARAEEEDKAKVWPWAVSWGPQIPGAHPHPEEEMGWSETTARSPSSGVQAGLLEPLGLLRVTPQTPAAFPHTPGDPHFLHQPPGLRGAPLASWPASRMRGGIGKAEGTSASSAGNVCMWGTPDICLYLREHPASAIRVR